jgi:hypothetical protein
MMALYWPVALLLIGSLAVDAVWPKGKGRPVLPFLLLIAGLLYFAFNRWDRT